MFCGSSLCVFFYFKTSLLAHDGGKFDTRVQKGLPKDTRAVGEASSRSNGDPEASPGDFAVPLFSEGPQCQLPGDTTKAGKSGCRVPQNLERRQLCLARLAVRTSD